MLRDKKLNKIYKRIYLIKKINISFECNPRDVYNFYTKKSAVYYNYKKICENG